MNNIFKFDEDAGFMEKFVTYAAVILIVGLLGYMYLSAFGVFNNFYATACKAAGWAWKIPGLAFAYGAYRLYKGLENDKFDFAKGSYPVLGIMIALSLASMAGFAYPYIF